MNLVKIMPKVCKAAITVSSGCIKEAFYTLYFYHIIPYIEAFLVLCFVFYNDENSLND